jgi:hypothetical protein
MWTRWFYYANKYVTNKIVESTTMDEMPKPGHGILLEERGDAVKSETGWREFLKFT